jgi:hypothetical protein
LFYEIPKNELNKDFLWNTQLKKTTIGAGYGGQAVGSRVVRWVLKGDKVLLENIDYSMVADPMNPLMDEANTPAIIRSFDVAAYSPSGDPVINVTAFFTTQIPPEFAAGARVGGRGNADPTRTFLEKAVSYPMNLNVEVTATWAITPDPAAADPGGGRGGGRGGGGGRGPSATVLVHHSMIKLPETPMMPRLFDERVGYFTQGLTDYGTGEQQQMQKRFITRYRLEKKDPNAAMSEPVKPIIYWVDPATPKKWVPCIKSAIESWQPAFEMAGFLKGIVAKEASESGDPDWSREDVRYSTIDYLPSTDRERGRSARARSTQRRDSRSGRAVLPQRHEPGEELVLRAGRPERSEGAAAAAARRSDVQPRQVRRGARSGSHARLPAQHEGQLHLHDRADSRSEVGEGKRPHAHADGLLALQLRGAAGRPHRSDRPDPEDRALRQVGDDVGIQADSRSEDA